MPLITYLKIDYKTHTDYYDHLSNFHENLTKGNRDNDMEIFWNRIFFWWSVSFYGNTEKFLKDSGHDIKFC
jgi:hypothetical protein